MSKTRLQFSEIKEIKGIYYPTSIREVQTLVQHAMDDNLLVRVAGSGHSVVDAIYAESKEQIKIQLYADEKQNELRKVTCLEKNEDNALVEIGGGCYIGINPADQSSNQENSLVYQLDKLGYALPQLGGISHQTISGFLATASSGGSTDSLHDIIEGVKFIDGTGQLRELKKGDPDFEAVVASVGLLGTAVSYTLRVPKRYYVKGEEQNLVFEESCLAPDMKGDYSTLKEALIKTQFAHFLWYPLAGRVCEYKAKAIPYQSSKPQPYEHVLADPDMALMASHILKETDELLASGKPDQIKKVGEKQKIFVPLRGRSSHQSFCDDSFNALPTDNQVFGLDSFMSMTFSEIWFPINQTNEVMHRLTQLFAKNPAAAGNLPLEIYASPKSPFLLSPSFGAKAIRIDIYWWNQNTRNMDQFFGFYYEALHDIPGLQFHWGKYLPKIDHVYGHYQFKIDDLLKNIPQLDEFLKIREKYDPDQRYVTPYWRDYLKIPTLKLEFNRSEKKSEEQEKAPVAQKAPARDWGMVVSDVFRIGQSYISIFSSRASASPEKKPDPKQASEQATIVTSPGQSRS